MSHLLIGGTKEERLKKALEIVNSENRVSKFDTMLIEGNEDLSIGIDQIRALSHRLSFRPYNSPAKAAIIHPAEILTIEAQNALLKMLEESSENSIIILTAPQIDSLLPTVVSRCQIIRLPTKLEITLSEKEICSTIHDLSSIIQSGVGERLKMAPEFGKEREEIKSWVEKQIFFWREVLLDREGEPNSQHVNMLTRCKTELKFLTVSQIIGIIRSLEKTRRLLEQNVNPKLALEVFLLDLPLLFMIK